MELPQSRRSTNPNRRWTPASLELEEFVYRELCACLEMVYIVTSNAGVSRYTETDEPMSDI